MRFGWLHPNRNNSSASKSKKTYRSSAPLVIPPTRTLRDVLAELFALLFQRARHTDPAIVFDQLTPREREIAAFAAQGYTNKEIAEELVISPDTVKTHMRNILTNLELREHRAKSLLLGERLERIRELREGFCVHFACASSLFLLYASI